MNLFEMYIDNGCRFGYHVTRDSWNNNKYAKVVSIDGVEEGIMIEGLPPYFNRKYPPGHQKEGKVWPRYVHLVASWFDDGEIFTSSGGTYSWSRVYPTDWSSPI